MSRLITYSGKTYRLRKFPPLEGRELMTKGGGVREVSRDLIFAYVDIVIGADNSNARFIPLSTLAMRKNHVAPADEDALFLAQLRYNCSEIDALLHGPTVADFIWETVRRVIEDVRATLVAELKSNVNS